MELDNSEYDVSRLIKLVKMAGGNKVFRELLEDIKTLKSISPSMIDKAANMLNE
jgi:L-2-hydroxyglutarate oxidase LhgO